MGRDTTRWIVDEQTDRLRLRPCPAGIATLVDPFDEYVEMFWLPILGPSALWMLRRFHMGLRSQPDGFAIGLAELGQQLGLGTSVAANSSTVRTLDRLIGFSVVTRVQDTRGSHVGVPAGIRMLSDSQVGRLTPMLQAAHPALTAKATS